MKKRPSRPSRFEMVDRDAIVSLPSILATGVLNHLIYSRDGDDVTVESLASRYDEGERVLEKAMRVLVTDGRVIKFKIQRAQSERVGEAVKRGGSWRTEFSVDAHGSRFTAEDVAEMYDEILSEGNARAVRVEPEYLDPRKNGLRDRPTPQNRGVGATCDDTENSQVGPTPRFAAPGRPGAGNRGALNRKETVTRDSLCDERGPEPQEGERETSATRQDDDDAASPQQADQHDEGVTGTVVADALAFQWRMMRGTAPGRRQLAQVAADAAEALADGDDPEWLLRTVVPFMVTRKYLDLGRARTHRECPAPRHIQEQQKTEAQRGPAPDCPDCSGSGWAEDPSGEREIVRCACVTAAA